MQKKQKLLSTAEETLRKELAKSKRGGRDAGTLA